VRVIAYTYLSKICIYPRAIPKKFSTWYCQRIREPTKLMEPSEKSFHIRQPTREGHRSGGLNGGYGAQAAVIDPSQKILSENKALFTTAGLRS
jgi:hypothetical protein